MDEGGGEGGVVGLGLDLGQLGLDAPHVGRHLREEVLDLLGLGHAGFAGRGAVAAEAEPPGSRGVGGPGPIDALLQVAAAVVGPGGHVADFGRGLAGLDAGLLQRGLDVGGVGVEVLAGLVEVGLQRRALVDVEADEGHGRAPWVSSARPSATR